MFRKRDGMSFTQMTQGSQRGVPRCSVFTGKVIARISKKTTLLNPLSFIGRYSLILTWRPLRPLRDNIIFQSTHCKQRGAKAPEPQKSLLN
jgi:hypothetical protein